MSDETKKKVKEAANQLADALAGFGELKTDVKEPLDTTTGGSAITVAEFERRDLIVAVWFDKWLDGERLAFWAGFGATKRNPVKKIVSDCSTVVLPSKTLQNDDCEQRGGIFCLKKKSRPTEAELQFPIQEYTRGSNGFGIYGRQSEAFDVRKATTFIESVIQSLPELSDDYSAVENRKYVVWHIRTERRPELARKCKERDGYRCKVCDFHFAEKYGDLGRDFAEAHHKVPLSTLQGEVKSTLEDLVTVCPNCHRMLHKMKGVETDLDELRKILAERKQAHPVSLPSLA